MDTDDCAWAVASALAFALCTGWPGEASAGAGSEDSSTEASAVAAAVELYVYPMADTRKALDDLWVAVAPAMTLVEAIGQARGTELFFSVDLDGDGPDDAVVSMHAEGLTRNSYVVRDVDSAPWSLGVLSGPWGGLASPSPIRPDVHIVGETTFIVNQIGEGSSLSSWYAHQVWEVGEDRLHLCGVLGRPYMGGHQSWAARPWKVWIEALPDSGIVIASEHILGVDTVPLTYVGLRHVDFEWREGSRVDMPEQLERTCWTQRYRWDPETHTLAFQPTLSDWPREPVGWDAQGNPVGSPLTVDELTVIAIEGIEALAVGGGVFDQVWIARLAEYVRNEDLRDRLLALIPDNATADTIPPER